MPYNVFQPAVPHNPINYSVPSKICLWWESICPDGSFDTPVTLGSISDFDFAPNETTVDLKSTYTGVMTTDQRVITDVSGTATFKLHEIAGTNVNLLFRPVTTESKTGANAETVYGQQRVNLTGTNAIAVATDAVEYDVTNNQVTRPNVTILAFDAVMIVLAFGMAGSMMG